MRVIVVVVVVPFAGFLKSPWHKSRGILVVINLGLLALTKSETKHGKNAFYYLSKELDEDMCVTVE